MKKPLSLTAVIAILALILLALTEAQAAESTAKPLRLELTRKTQSEAKSESTESGGAAKSKASGDESKPLQVPDFSLVHKSQKKSKTRAVISCQSRDGRSVKPGDPGFEMCMQSASQDPRRGTNIVHPGVIGADGEQGAPSVGVEHRIGD